VPFAYPLLLIASTPVARKFGSVNRHVLRTVLGEQVPAPPPMRPVPHLHVKTEDSMRLADLVSTAGGQIEQQNATKLKVTGLTAPQLAELAAREQVTIDQLKTHSGWLAGLGGLISPLWVWALAGIIVRPEWLAVLFVPAGAAALLAAPWLTRSVIAADRSMIRDLLGPSSLAQRVRDLEATRAHAVDDSAARLRSIERDLHDGAQAQLVGLAMKLGLAREKLDGGADVVAPADLDRAVELVELPSHA